MAYFRCSTGSASSGDGVALVVQCDANFAGSVITATNGTDTFTETCPSVSPYTVRFEGIPTGTYTISGVSQGQTFTTQFTVLDYETTLNATPEGATVLPINDIQIWLHCANIWDKTYTTIAQVLSDTSTLLALISSNNAVDYMVRSTSWASSVCANQTAMGYIGNNNYCADKLLSNSTWLNAICNSTYFESVLNVKVPTMTSNTTPSGVCSQSSYNDAAQMAWKAFDGNDDISTQFITNPSGGVIGQWIKYKFVNTVLVKKAHIHPTNAGSTTSGTLKCELQGSNNDSNWTKLSEFNITGTAGIGDIAAFDVVLSANLMGYQYYRIIATEVVSGTRQYLSFTTIQFYGRA